MIKKNKQLIYQIVKFLVVGTIAFIIDYSILIMLKELLHINVYVSVVIAYLISTVFNYFLSTRWVYDVKQNSSFKFAQFVIYSIIGLVLTELLMFIGIEIIGIHYLINKVLATLIVMVFNFITRKIFLERESSIDMKKLLKEKFTITNIFYTVALLLMSFIIPSQDVQNDLFFDIKTGESILKFGVDFKDHFSFIPNLKYLYHHWFYDVIIYYIHKFTGYVGVHFLAVLVFSIFLLFYFSRVKKIIKNKPLSLIFTLLVSWLCYYGFNSRVQTITYLLFFFEIFCLDKLYENKNIKYSILLILNSILIVNLHMPLWIFVIILYLPYLAECLVSYLSSKKNKFSAFLNKIVEVEKPSDYKSFLITFGLVLLTGLVSPFGLNAYTFFIKAFGSNAYSFIEEMKPTVLIHIIDVPIILLIGIVGLYCKLIKFKFRDFLLFMGLFLFSLIASRNSIYFIIFGPLIILRSLEFEKIKIGKIKFLDKILSHIKLDIVTAFSIVFLIAIYVFAIIKMDYKNYDFDVPFDYPVDVVNYIKKNLDYKNLKFYSDYNYGAYMLSQDLPVFIDSRSEVYTKEFNGGYDIENDYLNSSKIGKYKSVFNKYKFDYAVVYSKSTLDYLLILDEDATEVYTENGFVLYKINNDN